jgi:DNA-binding GntR family transcriptional regulator
MAQSVEKAYTAIRKAIIGQRFRPGERLKEERLAAELGVSRTPVREALRRLSAEGLLQLMPNQGVTVPAWSPKDVEDIFGLRLALETYGVEQSAVRATREQIEELETLCSEMEALVADGRPGHLTKVADRNRAFHRILAESGGGALLGRLLFQVIEMPLMMNTYHRYSGQELQRSLHHHRELTQAIRARDQIWAAAVMASHIQAGRNTYMRSVADAPPEDHGTNGQHSLRRLIKARLPG